MTTGGKFNHLAPSILLRKSQNGFNVISAVSRAINLVTREEAEKVVETFVRTKRDCTNMYVTSADSFGYGSWRIKGEYTLTVDGNPKTLFFEILVDPKGKITEYDLGKPVPIF